jgi:signal transduction histidine kinase
MLPDEVREEAYERVNLALTSAKRIENWSDFVLERVKKNRRTKQPINFAELVTVIFRAFQNSFSHRSIRPKFEVDKTVPQFIAFPIDLEAIIINLITNSVKALERVPLVERRIELHSVYIHTSQRLEINFSDSGPGIDIKDLPQPRMELLQIFEPFISGQGTDGTGMGLAVVDRIVKDYHGEISVQGHGKLGGAHFKISLPLELVEDGP